MPKLTINFENEVAIDRFMTWLENDGQDKYWEFMKKTYDNYEDGEKTTVVNFDFDYDEFVIDTELGEITIEDEDYENFRNIDDEEEE